MHRACLVLFATACTVHVESMPVGARMPALAPCAVRIEHIATKEAEQRYQEVGRVCISYTGTRSPDELERKREAREELASEACALGGNVVVPLDMCHLERVYQYRADGVSYHVYRDVSDKASDSSLSSPARN